MQGTAHKTNNTKKQEITQRATSTYIQETTPTLISFQDLTPASSNNNCPLINFRQLYHNTAVGQRRSKRLSHEIQEESETPSSPKKKTTTIVQAPPKIKRMLKELEEDRIETPPRRKNQKKDKNTPIPNPQKLHTPRMLKELTEDRLDNIQTLPGNKRKRVCT